MKILILAYKDKSVLPRILPDRNVGGAAQANVANMDGTWIDIGKCGDEARREIFIKDEPVWRLRQQGRSRRRVRAPRQRLGMPGCRRRSAAGSRQ